MEAGHQNGMKQNPDPSGDDIPDLSASGSVDEIVGDIGEEYTNISSTIDEIDTCLDALEQQNDSLYSKLQELLESSKQTRQELEAQRSTSNK